jgi:hypothetical protein
MPCRTYVNEATARSQNLTFASDNTFIMRADARTVLSASGPGRNSVRLRSKNVYTTHVAVYVIFFNININLTNVRMT